MAEVVSSALTIQNKAQKIRALGAKNEIFTYVSESFEEIQAAVNRLESVVRSSLDALKADIAANYYTKAQIDSLLAAKANTSHVHGTINIAGTTGTTAHTHVGTVT